MKTRPLKIRDINLQGGKTLKIEAFRFSLKLFFRENPRLFLMAKGINPTVPKKSDQIFWRASDLYFFLSSGTKVSIHEVFHATVHCLLAKKFGVSLVGRPHFILLCEALASSSDFYLDLEAGRLFGATKKQIAAAQERLYRAMEIWGEKKSQSVIVSLINSHSERQSFRTYQRLTLEMFKYYLRLLELVKKRDVNSKLDYLSMFKELRKHKHAPLFYQYELGNNLLYALYHGGQSTKSDQKSVSDCIDLLKSSNSFTDFLKKLSMPTAQKFKVAA